ncbi:MAG: rod shape-determining protein MreD [Thermaerobacterales bacterium]
MARHAWLGLAVVLVVVLQTAVFPVIPIYRAVPDLALVFAILLGFLAGSRRGVAAALVAGGLLDLWSGRLIGLHLLLKGGAAYAGALVGRQVYRDNAPIAFMCVAIASVAQDVVVFIVIRLLGIPFPLYRATYEVMLPALLYNLLLTPLIYLILYGLTDDLASEEEIGRETAS